MAEKIDRDRQAAVLLPDQGQDVLTHDRDDVLHLLGQGLVIVDDIPGKGKVATKNRQEDADQEAPVLQAQAPQDHIHQGPDPAHDIEVETDISPVDVEQEINEKTQRKL